MFLPTIGCSRIARVTRIVDVQMIRCCHTKYLFITELLVENSNRGKKKKRNLFCFDFNVVTLCHLRGIHSIIPITKVKHTEFVGFFAVSSKKIFSMLYAQVSKNCRTNKIETTCFVSFYGRIKNVPWSVPFLWNNRTNVVWPEQKKFNNSIYASIKIHPKLCHSAEWPTHCFHRYSRVF